MATLTDVVAAVVVHSSAFAFSPFGIALEPPQAEVTRTAQPAATRVVARSPRKAEKTVVRAKA